MSCTVFLEDVQVHDILFTIVYVKSMKMIFDSLETISPLHMYNSTYPVTIGNLTQRRETAYDGIVEREILRKQDII